MQTLQQQLIKILAEIELLEPQKRALISEYMPIRDRLIELEDMKDNIENKIWEIESMDEDDGVKTIEESDAEDMATMLDEMKNPEDYAGFDIKDLESSIA